VKKLTQPIKWHGGKHYLAPWILGMMPPHLHYVEPFFGGGSVLLARDPERDWMRGTHETLPASLKGCSEVVNDLDQRLTDFWQVLRDDEQFEQFQKKIALTPFSQNEFEAAIDLDFTPKVQRAVDFFIRARQSRQGLMKDFATLSRTRTRSRINEQVSAWLGAVEGLADVHERLKNVVILNEDANKVIRSQDGPFTLFYCDPPYLHETRTAKTAYAHEMTKAQHEELLETLAGIKGHFMLSGYPSDLYAKYAKRHKWRFTEKMIDNKSSGGKTKELKTECIWYNY